MHLKHLFLSLLVLLVSSRTARLAGAQNAAAAPDISAPAPATQPSDAASDLLGPKFISKYYSVEFRPPAQSTEAVKPGGEMIAIFNRDNPGLELKVWRTHLQNALPLTLHKDQFGQVQDGVLEKSIAQITANTPGVQVKRNEVINVGSISVGMIGVRYQNAKGERRYTQQAIFAAPNSGDALYYFFQLNGPGKPQAEPEDIENPAERLAYQTFSKIVDSVVLLDRADIKKDQDDRLFRTMALYVNWSGAQFQTVRAALAPEQYQRIVRDGKDIGYSYIVEEFEEKPKDIESSTIRIGMRSRVMPAEGIQWDSSTWMSSSADHKHEIWNCAAVCTNPKGETLDSFTQLASSDELNRAIVLQAQPQAAGGGLMPPQGLQGNIGLDSVRKLQVTSTRVDPATHLASQLPQFEQETPAFFLPQAFGFLLPQLLPLNRPTGYMFASFVPASSDDIARNFNGQIMARYMDVLPAAEVDLNGRKIQAIEIDDRLGYDGDPVRNYLSPDGKFLGSCSTYTQNGKKSTQWVLPSDRASLERLWAHPELSRPQELPPHGAAAGGNGAPAPQ
jgi:hypothetical protein